MGLDWLQCALHASTYETTSCSCKVMLNKKKIINLTRNAARFGNFLQHNMQDCSFNNSSSYNTETSSDTISIILERCLNEHHRNVVSASKITIIIMWNSCKIC